MEKAKYHSCGKRKKNTTVQSRKVNIPIDTAE